MEDFQIIDRLDHELAVADTIVFTNWHFSVSIFGVFVVDKFISHALLCG